MGRRKNEVERKSKLRLPFELQRFAHGFESRYHNQFGAEKEKILDLG